MNDDFNNSEFSDDVYNASDGDKRTTQNMEDRAEINVDQTSQNTTQDESTVYRYSRSQLYGNQMNNNFRNSTYGGQSGNYQNGGYGYGQGSAYQQNRGNAYSQNGYSQSSYQQNSAYGSNYSQNNSYNSTGGTNYNNANNVYQGYQYQQPKVKKNKRKVALSGWKKVICYGLIFGLVAGVVFEGIHFAGNAILGNRENNQVNERTINVVRVSSEEVDAIQMQGVSDVVKEVMPSVVAVNTVVEQTIRDFFGRTYSQEGAGAGSGFIFSEDEDYLYLATNYHVIEDSTSISVVFNDGTSANAIVRGYDENADVAVIMIKLADLSDETKGAIKTAVIGDSDAMEAGNGSIAIGNALGYGQSVTTGAISAVERTVQLTDGEMTLIQTEAAINPGNSGGPLLNARGEVIGINTIKYSETTVEGMGFAIPINSAMETIEGIISGEIVNKSDADSVYFGIRGGTVTEALAEEIGSPQGVYVGYVYSGSAAQRAGLQVGYIITEFDGVRVTTFEDLQECLAQHKPGDSVTLVVYTPNNDGSYSNSQILSTILGSMAEAPQDNY